MATVSLIPRSVPLELYAGDGVELRLTVTGVELDENVIAEIRENRADETARTTFTVTVDGNVVTLRLTGAQTAELGRFRGAWDCQWTPAGLEPRTIVQGAVTCSLDVSRNGGP